MTTYLFLAEGFEEIEALTPVDLLRRAGMDIKTVSIGTTHRVTGAHGISVEADLTFKQADFSDAQWLICPGGMPGAANLHAFQPLNDLLRVHHTNGRGVAAICASPAVVLAPLGIVNDKVATCYPSFEGGLEAGGARHEDARVVEAGNVITSNGPSSAEYFALAIIRATLGAEKAVEVAKGLLLYPAGKEYYA